MTITSDEMMVLDTNCQYHGLSTLQLMENAGKALAEEIIRRFEPGTISIYAGLGNNGGDAFVAARFLKEFDIKVFLLGKSSDIRTEISKKNFEILKRANIPITEIRDSSMLKTDNSDVIIDAMLGTGVRGKLREPFLTAVKIINSSKAYKVAVDVPTGLSPDTGEGLETVNADLTVTFHAPKPGLEKLKEVVVKDIGIPLFFEKLIGPGDVKKLYFRDPSGHKGSHGKILIIGGGPYSGAPALTAMAAYSAGVDLVTIAAPESVSKIVASFSPNLIVKPLKGNVIDLRHIDYIKELIKKNDVVVAGMGTEDKGDFAEELLKYTKKVVLDAGALTSRIPENEEIDCILTPHKAEFERIFGIEAKGENEVIKAAKKSNSTILLKSPEDIISDGKRIKVNRTGNPGMTVGGTGDVLAGIVGAFLCKNNGFWSSCAASFINGRAGDLCLEKMGYNFTATDIINRIPEAIMEARNFA